jgi:membrane protease YdiL (CAAX protease family)
MTLFLQLISLLLLVCSPYMLLRLYKTGYFSMSVKQETKIGLKDLFIPLSFMLLASLMAIFTLGFLQKEPLFHGLVVGLHEAAALVLFLTCLILLHFFILYFVFMDKEKRRALLGKDFSLSKTEQIKKGALFGFACNSLLFLTLYGTDFLLLFFGIKKEPSWNPYLFIKESFPLSFIFSIQLFNLVLLLPIIEEIVFRGFLQRYAIGRWGVSQGVFATGLFFAFTSRAFPENIQSFPLYFALFLLSLLASIACEKNRSLLASIAFRVEVISCILFIGFCFA